MKSKLSLQEAAKNLIKKGNKNMSYVNRIVEERIENNDVISKYLPLLDLVEFDKMNAMMNYRCNKALYDRYKSRNDNGVYRISEEDRSEMIEKRLWDESRSRRKRDLEGFRDHSTV